MQASIVPAIFKTGNGEQGTGNWERGTGNPTITLIAITVNDLRYIALF